MSKYSRWQNIHSASVPHVCALLIIVDKLNTFTIYSWKLQSNWIEKKDMVPLLVNTHSSLISECNHCNRYVHSRRMLTPSDLRRWITSIAFIFASLFTEIEAIEVIHLLQSAGLCFLRPWAFQLQWDTKYHGILPWADIRSALISCIVGCQWTVNCLLGIFRYFYQVNFSHQNIVNRKEEVGLDIRFSGVQKIHMQMRIWKRLWWWCNMAFRLADTRHFHE